MNHTTTNKNKKHKTISRGAFCLVFAMIISLFAAIPASAGTVSYDYTDNLNFETYTPFADVDDSNWGYGEIMYCYALEIVEGVSENTFDPDGELTRAQFITMVGRANFEDEVQAQALSSDSWYSAYVRYMNTNGYLVDVNSDESSLNEGMPRLEMACLLKNIYFTGIDEYPFEENAIDSITDADEIDTAYESYYNAINFTYNYGLLTGFEDGSFRPDETVTRQQACAVLARVDNLVNSKIDGMHFTKALYTLAVTDTDYDSYTEIDGVGMYYDGKNHRAGNADFNALIYEGEGNVSYKTTAIAYDAELYPEFTGTTGEPCAVIDSFMLGTYFVLWFESTGIVEVTATATDDAGNVLDSCSAIIVVLP